MSTPVFAIGSSMIWGGQGTVSGYINVTQRSNEADHDISDVFDGAGVLKARYATHVWPKVTLNLKPYSGTNPVTDFPVPGVCQAAGSYLYWFVDTAPLEISKDPQVLAVTLSCIGITV